MAEVQRILARNIQGFTLAATNHEHLLDPAVWRRFEARIQIPKPEAGTRAVLLGRFLEPVRLSAAEMRMLVWLTEGMSGADVKTLITGGKRYLVLHNKESRRSRGNDRPTPAALLSALRRQATLNALLFDKQRQKLLMRSDEVLLDARIEHAGFTQAEAASLMGVSQSTVSRRLKSQEQEQARQGQKSEV